MAEKVKLVLVRRCQAYEWRPGSLKHTFSVANMRACKLLMICCLLSVPNFGGPLRDSIASALFSSLLKSCTYRIQDPALASQNSSTASC